MRFVRMEEVVAWTGLSRTTIWRMEQEGQFPSRRALSAGAVGWLEDEVIQWMKDRQTVTLGSSSEEVSRG